MPHKRSKASSDYRRHRGVTRRAGLPDPPPIPVELQRLPEEAFLRPRSKAVLKPRPKWRSRSDSPNWSSSEAARPAKRARVGRPASPQPVAKAEVKSEALPAQLDKDIDEIFRVKKEKERLKTEVKSEVQKEAEIALSLLAGLAQPVKVIEQDSPCSASPETDPICWEAPVTPVTDPKESTSSSSSFSSSSSSENESAASGRVDGKAKSAVGTTPTR